MYILNTTFVVEPPIHAAWYDIVTNKYIPFVRDEGYSIIAFSRILNAEQTAHYTYSLQIDIDDIADYQRFINDIMGEYTTITNPIFGEQALHFCTLLKKIEI